MSAPAGPSRVARADVPWRGLPEHSVTGVVMTVLPLVVAAYFFHDAALVFAVRAVVLGVACVAAAIFFLVRGAWPGLGARRRIRDRPGDVVWIYDTVRTVNGQLERKLKVGFVDRRLESWSIDAPLVEQPRLRTWIAQHLSHATVGYSDERLARFNAGPRDLLLPAQGQPR
jgi:hypothetical protein